MYNDDQNGWYEKAGEASKDNNSDKYYTPDGASEYSRKKPKAQKAFSFGQVIAIALVMALVAGAAGAGIAAAINASSAVAQVPAVSETAQQEPPVSESEKTGSDTPSGSGASVTLNVSNAPKVYSSESEMIQSSMKSVVAVFISQNVQGMGGQTSSTDAGAGSGVIVSADGYIVTNNHVIAGADDIRVTLQDGSEYSAKLIATDTVADLAVIKIDATDLPAATIGSSEAMAVGETVYAIGNALGEYTTSVSRGIISGLERTVTVESYQMTLMQTDAAVNPGNSGGGLFNAQGELIGIVNAKSYGTTVEGMGFAIPMDRAREVVSDLIELGYVSGRPYLGITMQQVAVPVTDENGVGATGFNDYFFQNGYGYGNYETRVQIVDVVANGPAANGGAQSGDVILTLDGEDIHTATELTSALYTHTVGDTVHISVLRNNAEVELDIILGEYRG